MEVETKTKFSAVIFDMDGVLIDSEVHWDTTETAFLSSRGLPPVHTLKHQVLGKSMSEYAKILKEHYHLPDTVEQLAALRKDATDAIYDHMTNAMPGATTLLHKVKQAQLRTAIASGSYLYRIQTVVNRFGWLDYLDVLASADHVNFVGKPAPDVFLYAAAQLAMSPEDCVVIEDSVNGVAAAKAAGMKCIAAIDKRWSYGDYSAADLVVDSLTDPALYDFIGVPL